ncbi:MAG: hypothetical protein BJ554DRAFT_2862, partial [Olpidium bornovanus]
EAEIRPGPAGLANSIFRQKRSALGQTSQFPAGFYGSASVASVSRACSCSLPRASGDVPGGTFTSLRVRQRSSARNVVTSERILAVEVMLEPLIKRFRYHFMGKRLTNRLEKVRVRPAPAVFHTMKYPAKASPQFIRGEIQLLLDESGLTEYVAQASPSARGRATPDASGRIYLWPNRRHRRQLADDIPRLLRHPGFISHTMTEAFHFDEAIRNDYLYLDPAAGAEWPGTMEVLAGNQEVFDAFLRTEKECEFFAAFLDATIRRLYPLDPPSHFRVMQIMYRLQLPYTNSQKSSRLTTLGR